MSLRTRLTFYYTTFFMAALLMLGFGTYIAVQQSLERGVEEDLRAGARQVLAIYERSPAGGLEFVLRNGEAIPEQLRGQPAEIFVIPNLFAQVFSPTGEFVGSSMPMRDFPGIPVSMEDPALPLPPAALNLGPNDELYVRQQIDGVDVQSFIKPVQLISTGQIVGILQISRSLEDVETTLHMLLSILLGGGAIALVGTAFGVAGLSRTALAPIDQVVHTARGIVNAEDLEQRVPVPHSQDELHRLTVTINDLLARLDSLFKMQHRLLADVSHELRTPLAAMRGNLEVLERGAHRNPELLQESLEDMRRETARLIRMVNDLLLLAKSEARVQVPHGPVELDTLLLEVHRELRALAGQARLTIGAEDQIVVIGDRDRIKQALLNLGVNAIQHTPPEGTITLSLERRDEYAAISVHDTGVGIAPEELSMIFKRFYRADPSRTSRSRAGGAGLGLAIVQHVAEVHNGRVTVESVLGEGSLFAIWLPLPVEQKQPESSNGSSQPAIMRPLLVEDKAETL